MRPMASPPRSRFEDVLRRSRVREPDGVADDPAALVRSTPWYVPDTAAGRGTGKTADPGGYYREAQPAPRRDEPAAKPKSVDPDDIAMELDLAACPDLAALKRSRRRFAAANHPDRVDPALRENATARMMIANRLIDQEMRLLRTGDRERTKA